MQPNRQRSVDVVLICVDRCPLVPYYAKECGVMTVRHVTWIIRDHSFDGNRRNVSQLLLKL
jgi:hypothetical protein